VRFVGISLELDHVLLDLLNDDVLHFVAILRPSMDHTGEQTRVAERGQEVRKSAASV